jgi:DNA-binding HxlR family transcriptional regulator
VRRCRGRPARRPRRALDQIILRNLLLGCRTFNEIAAGAPGLSRALLTRRLHELERAGLVEIRPKPNGHGSLYKPTPAGRDLWGVLLALGDWAERWIGVTVTAAPRSGC